MRGAWHQRTDGRGEDRHHGGHRQPSERGRRSAWGIAGPRLERILGERSGNRSEETRHPREQGQRLRPKTPCDCGNPNSANTNGPKLWRQMVLCRAARQDRQARDRLWGWRRKNRKYRQNLGSPRRHPEHRTEASRRNRKREGYRTFARRRKRLGRKGPQADGAWHSPVGPVYACWRKIQEEFSKRFTRDRAAPSRKRGVRAARQTPPGKSPASDPAPASLLPRKRTGSLRRAWSSHVNRNCLRCGDTARP